MKAKLAVVLLAVGALSSCGEESVIYPPPQGDTLADRGIDSGPGDATLDAWDAGIDSVADQVGPEMFVPDQLVPDRFVPDQLVPDRFVPDQLVPDQLVPDMKVLDMCEKMARSEGLTCKSMGNQKVTSLQNWAAGCYQLINLTIDSAGTLLLQTNAVSKTPTTIIAKQVVVEAGAVIHSDYQGYAHDSGPGRGWTTSSSLGSGAGHGGKGGPRSGNPAGATYGDRKYPILAGSGGGSKIAGSGGGAIRICAATKITVNGHIRALGQTLNVGGSGGSILLITPLMEGKGTIDASGGTPTSTICGGVGGGGGGGRIAIRATTNKYTGTTRVNGGTSTCFSGSVSGMPGTVYLGGLP